MAIGQLNTASGVSSVSFGKNNTSSGNNSLTSGYSAEAIGDNSTAIGNRVKAYSYASTVLGQYNSYNNLESVNSWVNTNSLFILGNGTSDLARSNALTILKNGNVAINSTNPGIYKLKVVGGNANLDVGKEWLNTSDIRLKKNITPLGKSLKKVRNMRGVKYHSLEENKNDKMHIGLIAQEVEKQYPVLITSDTTSEENYMSLSYRKLTPILLQAIQELNSENERLESRVTKLREKLKILKNLKQENIQ